MSKDLLAFSLLILLLAHAAVHAYMQDWAEALIDLVIIGFLATIFKGTLK